MSQTFGIEAPHGDPSHAAVPKADVRPPARYLVLIDTPAEGGRRAYLYDESRRPIGEFDAAQPEVTAMTDGLVAAQDAGAAEWNATLSGHDAEARAAAKVYTLPV